MSQVIPGTSQVEVIPGTNVPAKSQVYSLVPRPMSTWNYLGYPGMSQLRASYTALFQGYLGLPETSLDVPAKSQLHSLVPCVPGITWDILGCPN